MLYSVSAALTVGIVPFTIIFMKATNDALYVRATAGEKDKAGGETRTLVQRWLVLNQVRGLLPLVGAGVAAWAILFNA